MEEVKYRRIILKANNGAEYEIVKDGAALHIKRIDANYGVVTMPIDEAKDFFHMIWSWLDERY